MAAITPQAGQVQLCVGVHDVSAGGIDPIAAGVLERGGQLVRGDLTAHVTRHLIRAEVRAVREREQDVTTERVPDLRVRTRRRPQVAGPLRPVRDPGDDIEQTPLRKPGQHRLLQLQRRRAPSQAAATFQGRFARVIDHEISVARVAPVHRLSCGSQLGFQRPTESDRLGRKVHLGAILVQHRFAFLPAEQLRSKVRVGLGTGDRDIAGSEFGCEVGEHTDLEMPAHQLRRRRPGPQDLQPRVRRERQIDRFPAEMIRNELTRSSTVRLQERDRVQHRPISGGRCQHENVEHVEQCGPAVSVVLLEERQIIVAVERGDTLMSGAQLGQATARGQGGQHGFAGALPHLLDPVRFGPRRLSLGHVHRLPDGGEDITEHLNQMLGLLTGGVPQPLEPLLGLRVDGGHPFAEHRRQLITTADLRNVQQTRDQRRLFRLPHVPDIARVGNPRQRGEMRHLRRRDILHPLRRQAQAIKPFQMRQVFTQP